MYLFLVRHAPAEDPECCNSDAERPLTEIGCAAAQQIGVELCRLNMGPMPQLIISSPYLRATQTAQLAFPELEPRLDPRLTPEARVGSALQLIEELLVEKVPSVALVTHNPLVSLLGATLIGADRPVLNFRRGAVAIYEIYSLQLPAKLNLFLAPPRP